MNPAVGALVGAVISGAPTVALRPWLARAGYRYPDEVELTARRSGWVVPTAVVAGAAVGAAWSSRPALAVVYAVAVGVLTILSAIDIDVHRLPDVWTLPALALTPVLLLVVALVEGEGLTPWWRALACGVGTGVLFLLLFVLGGGSGLGFGDVKLAPSIGALFGYLSFSHVVVWFMTAFLLAGVVALALLLRGRDRKSTIPFGPFMALSAGLVLAAPALTLGLS